MIPILYNADETRFVTNGVGRLSDCTRAVVTEERNGIYELEFDMPIIGNHFEEISLGKIVACTHDDKHDIQPFIIYQKSIPDLNGIVTFNAHHISYRLCDVVVMPFEAGSVVEALNKIGTESVHFNPFSFWTDKTTTANFKNNAPRRARNMLGGEENSILDVFGGGEYEFDKFDVKLYAHRGQDTSVEIRYGKNLSELNQTVSEEFTYNAVVPYWKDLEGTIVTLPERMIVFEGIEPQITYLTDENLIIIRTEDNEPIEVAYSVVDAVPMDLSDAFEEAPTVEQLRATATARFENSGAWLPDENTEVNFVQLWQTEEYKDYAALQRVSLCDTVSVYYPQGGVAVTQKVVKVTYNVLADRYDSIELGSLQTTLGQAIETKILENVPTNSMMDSAIQYATDLIRGGLGGYVVMTPGDNGYPQEILIMDTPDVSTAVNVWRFNQGGLGHSHNGYNGPFNDIALTQDGKINASMITTGTLIANLIKAGTLSDGSGANYWNLESGQLVTARGRVGPFTIDRSSLTYTNTGRALIKMDSDGYRSRLYAYWPLDQSHSISGVDLYYGNIYFVDDPNLSNLNTNRRVMDIYLGRWDNAPAHYSVSIRDELGSENLAEFRNYRTDANDHKIRLRGGVYIDDGGLYVSTFADVEGDFWCGGTKGRKVTTDNYSDRLLYAYETPTPIFGDIGEAVIDIDGYCYVDLDDIFTETIDGKVEYQVFLQKEGEGDCWIADKQPRYFVIQGTPNLKVAWELKAKQRDYALTRLEQPDNRLDEHEDVADITTLMNDYINEQEELLYG